MLFNFETCKCLHTGHGNLDVNYKMADTVLSTTVKEHYLGLTITMLIWKFQSSVVLQFQRLIKVMFVNRNITSGKRTKYTSA